MASATLHMGYMGIAKIDGTAYFMSGSSLNPVQSADAPDVVGGWEMKRGWVYSKVDVSGNITGPLHEDADSLWDLAVSRTADGDHLTNTNIPVVVAFYKGGGWSFTGCAINSLTFAVTAGEVINFTVDFAGTDAPTQASGEAIPCSKLVTWDQCAFSSAGTGGSTNFQSINFTLNNNVQKAYAVQAAVQNTNGLYPIDLPCGVREITGTISAYAEGDIGAAGGGADSWSEYAANAAVSSTFQVSAVSINITFNAVFSRPEGSGATGWAIYTMNFIGVCDLV